MDRTALVHSLKKLGSVFGLACVIIACIIGLQLFAPQLFARLDNFFYDTFMRANASGKVHPAILIIDIDEKSLKKQGQWPWPRHLLAELVRKLGESGVLAIGLDVLLAEPDRSSPVYMQKDLGIRFGEWLDIARLPAKLRDNDAYLAETLARHPVVVAALGTWEKTYTNPANLPQMNDLVERTLPNAKPVREYIPQFPGLILPLEQFTDVAPIGLINAYPGSDGVLRSVPSLIYFGMECIYTTLAVRTLMLAMKKKKLRLDSDRDGLTEIGFSKFRVQVNQNGNFMPVFHGPARSYPYISATDILEDRVAADKLAGRIAFVGTSAAGLMDIRNTPLGLMPGVEVHATIVDNILTGESVCIPPWAKGANVMLTVIVGLAATFLFCLTRALAYVPICGFLVGGAIYVSWTSFGAGLFLSPVPSVITFLVCTLAILPVRFWREERGRREIKQAFSRYVAPEVVSRIMDRGGVPLGGEQKEVSVLFTDVRGFTTLSEKLDPEQVVQLLNRYFTPMTACVKERKGTLDKFVGDALMAFWNAPIDVKDHARKAVAAACAMQNELARLRPEFLREFGVEIHIGAGINTGLAHVGNMGSAELLDYTCIGDNVNLASRLEGLCRRYGVGIIVSADTAKACGDAFRFRHLDRIRVKGKSQPVDIYCPLDETAFVAERESLWSEALALYLKGDFAEAAKAFASLSACHAELATPCTLYLERCRDLIANPPTAWGGVWTYNSK